MEYLNWSIVSILNVENGNDIVDEEGEDASSETAMQVSLQHYKLMSKLYGFAHVVIWS